MGGGQVKRANLTGSEQRRCWADGCLVWKGAARRKQFNHGTKQHLLTDCCRQSCHHTHTHTTCTLTVISWQTSAQATVSEVPLFTPSEYMKYGAWLYQLARGNQTCICGINKHLLPDRVQVCFQRTLQPTLLFWLWGTWLDPCCNINSLLR